VYYKFRLGQTKNASEKIFMVEEDYRTINDGLWSPITWTGANTNVPGFDWLAIHHDRNRKEPDVPNVNGWAGIPNPDRQGNAAFLDGHAEYVSRTRAHTDRNVIPEK
jgi:prepilin-type processing-associated H-X9-DG protein